MRVCVSEYVDTAVQCQRLELKWLSFIISFPSVFNQLKDLRLFFQSPYAYTWPLTHAKH